MHVKPPSSPHFYKLLALCSLQKCIHNRSDAYVVVTSSVGVMNKLKKSNGVTSPEGNVGLKGRSSTWIGRYLEEGGLTDSSIILIDGFFLAF